VSIFEAKRFLTPRFKTIVDALADYNKEHDATYYFSGTCLTNAYHGFKQTDIDFFINPKDTSKYADDMGAYLEKLFQDGQIENYSISEDFLYSLTYIDINDVKFNLVVSGNNPLEQIDSHDLQHTQWFTKNIEENFWFGEEEKQDFFFYSYPTTRMAIENKWLLPTFEFRNLINKVMANIAEEDEIHRVCKMLLRIKKFKARGMIIPEQSDFKKTVRSLTTKLKDRYEFEKDTNMSFDVESMGLGIAPKDGIFDEEDILI